MTYNRREIGIGGSIWATGIMLTLSSLLIISQLTQQIQKMNYKKAQLRLCFIILAPVLIGWPSWIVLILGPDAGILEYVGDLFKGIILFIFVDYSIILIGWEKNETESEFSQARAEGCFIRLENVKQICECIGSTKIKNQEDVSWFLNKVRIAALQACIVFLCLLVVSVILKLISGDYLRYGDMDPIYGFFWINMFKMLSATVALYQLFTYLKNISQIPQMKLLQIRSKSYMILVTLVLTLYQSAIIGGLSRWSSVSDEENYSRENITSYTSNLLICVEMIVLALIQGTIFTAEDYSIDLHK